MKNKLLVAILCVFIYSCNNVNREKIVDKSELTGDDYRLFQKTPAWKLAKAVQDENEKMINEIVAKEPNFINYQEPYFGSTLLMMTIKNQQYKPFEILLKNKADVNIFDTYEGSTALIEACNSKYYDLKFAEKLIKFGSNVNAVQTDIEKQGKTKTPLMMAVKTGNLDLVELLIKNGANVNYQNEFRQSALSEAIMTNRYNTAYFLLQNGADYREPVFFRPDYSTPSDKQDRNERGKPMYLVDVLRESPSGHDEDKYKLRIIDFLKSKGINY